MTHPDEGRLRAFLDEELPEPEAADVRAHVGSCVACDAALRGAEETQVLTTALLDALDGAVPIERVRTRLAERRAQPVRPIRRRWVGPSELAKAAALVLAFGGAVAAAVHPTSPLRRLIMGQPEAAVRTAPVLETAPTAEVAAAPREVGVRIAVLGAGAQITLSGAAPGSAIEVTWVDESAAAVYAPEGTTFSTAESAGRIDAQLAAGPVRIEIPRAATRASLTVDGRAYLRKVGERVDYPDVAALVEGARVRFEVR